MKPCLRRAAFGSVLLALIAAPREIAALPLILDDFDGPSGGQSVSISRPPPQGQSTSGVASGTGAVGDTRHLFLYVFPPGGSGSVQAEANGSGAPGAFVLSESPGLRSIARITYDAGGAGLGLDLTAAFGFFSIEGIAVDQPTSFGIDVQASGGSVSSGRTLEVPAGFSGTLVFPRSLFEGDLTNVRAIQLSVYSPEFGAALVGGDVRIERFVANPIPEPSTVLGLGAGLALLAVWRRR